MHKAHNLFDTLRQKRAPAEAGAQCTKLVLLVADVSFLVRIEEQIADGSNQNVDATGQIAPDNVGAGSGGVAFNLQRSVVDDQAADPAQEKGKQETHELIVIPFIRTIEL